MRHANVLTDAREPSCCPYHPEVTWLAIAPEQGEPARVERLAQCGNGSWEKWAALKQAKVATASIEGLPRHCRDASFSERA
jgi:hypothetical protein